MHSAASLLISHARLPSPQRLPFPALANTTPTQLHAHLTGSISRDCLHAIWLTKHAQDGQVDLCDPLTALPAGKVDYDIET